MFLPKKLNSWVQPCDAHRDADTYTEVFVADIKYIQESHCHFNHQWIRIIISWRNIHFIIIFRKTNYIGAKFELIPKISCTHLRQNILFQSYLSKESFCPNVVSMIMRKYTVLNIIPFNAMLNPKNWLCSQYQYSICWINLVLNIVQCN